MCVPELKVPLASSGDTSLDKRDMMTPSRAFKKTKTRIDPQMYCIDEVEKLLERERECVCVCVCVYVCAFDVCQTVEVAAYEGQTQSSPLQ